MELRHYQLDAVQAAWTYMHVHYGASPARHGLLVLPTGAGKSLIIADLVRRILEADPRARVLMLTHVKELIEQNHAKLRALLPTAPVGIYSAGLGKRDTGSRVVFAGIQSVYQRTDEFGIVNVLIVDEVHLVPKDGEGMYRTAIAELQRENPNLLILGLTATPFRTDGGYLHEGPSALFTDIAYESTLDRMINEGWLCRPTVKATRSEFSVAGVGKTAGEYNASALERAIAEQADVTRAALAELVQRGKDRRSWLLFCTGVAHAEHVAAQLREEHGIVAECVTGATPSDERARILDGFKSGSIQALTNMGVLTTGFDAPRVDLLVLLRPTCSTVLYVQMIGRGMRLSPETGKENLLVLDFAGNVRRHGPVNRVRVRKQKDDEGPGEAPTKTCPEDLGGCGSVIYTGFRECPDCGYVFPPPKPKTDAEPEQIEDVYADPKTPVDLEVLSVSYHAHVPRDGRAPSVRVQYRTGAFSHVSEWVCPEHEGYAHTKFLRWWAARASTEPPDDVPETVLRAPIELREPGKIRVNYAEKFPRVVSYADWREPGGLADPSTLPYGDEGYVYTERESIDAIDTIDDSSVPF